MDDLYEPPNVSGTLWGRWNCHRARRVHFRLRQERQVVIVVIVMFIVALVLFVLAALGVDARRVSLLALGLAFLTLGLLLPLLGVR